jgi:signal transduction histidine kinase
MSVRSSSFNPLYISAVVGYFGVAITGILDTDSLESKAWVAGLMALFGIVNFLPEFKAAGKWQFHLRLLLLTGLVTAMLLIQPHSGLIPILFFLMSPTTLIWFPNKAGVVWVTVYILVTAVIFIGFGGSNGLIQLLPYSAGYAFFAIFGWTTVQAIHARSRSEQLLAELQEAHAQLQEYSTRVEELTITQERNRIAREMHDALGHRLTVSAVQLEGAQRLVRSNPEKAEQILGTVREQIREGLGELRRTVAILRSPMEEDLPLEQALPKLANQVREATGIQVNLSLENCPDLLSAPYRQAIYRAAQEGLTNIQRHSQASEAWLHLGQREDQITLLISDNGVGMASEKSHAGFGLTGLKERAALLGGDFFIDPRPGGGTQLTFRLPVLKETQHERNCGE